SRPVLEGLRNSSSRNFWRSIALQRCACGHAGWVIPLVRHQKGTAPHRLEAAHVPSIASSHIYGSVERDFGRSEKLIQLPPEYRRPGDHRYATRSSILPKSRKQAPEHRFGKTR